MLSKTFRPTLVFVYGTLKRGGAWHSLLRTAEFMGTARTVDRYPMLIQSIPYLLNESAGHHIEGEVFAIDHLTLQALDALEGHPGWYRRQLKPVTIAGDTVEAFIYFLTPKHYRKANWRAAPHHSVYPIE